MCVYICACVCVSVCVCAYVPTKLDQAGNVLCCKPRQGSQCLMHTHRLAGAAMEGSLKAWTALVHIVLVNHTQVYTFTFKLLQLTEE